MPVKDSAREAAFAAMKASHADIVRVCREIHDDPEPAGEEQRASARLTALLQQYGFEVESGVAGLPTAFRATKLNHDTDAMRKGLRHGHAAFIVRADADPASGHVDGRPLGLAVTLSAAIGLGAGLNDEFGTVTIIGAPGDAGLVAMARAGIFDEFDAVLGAQPAVPGEGFCYTVDGTGDTLAVRTASVTVAEGDASGSLADLIAAIEAEATSLEAPTSVSVGSRDGNSIELNLTGRTSIELRNLSDTVQRLVDAVPGASISFGDATDDMIVNRILARRTKTYADTLGYKMDKIHKTEPGSPTGWGSVSYATPAFVLHFPFTSEPVTRGDRSFAVAAASSASYDRAFQFAESLCMTGLDVLRDMQFRSIADDQLVKTLRNRGIARQHRRWLGVHPVMPDTNGNGSSKNGKKGPRLADFRMVRGPGMRDN